MKNPCKNDWSKQVEIDLKDLHLEAINLEKLKATKKDVFKKTVKERIRALAFDDLMKKKKKHRKMNDLSYTKLEIKDYLRDEETSIEEKRTAFKWRTRMENFGHNYKGGRRDIPCHICGDHEDIQIESFRCKEIIDHTDVDTDYNDIFMDRIPRNIRMKMINKIV